MDQGEYCKDGARRQLYSRNPLRLHSFANRGAIRIVVDEKGLLTEDGCLIPKDALISFVSYPAQVDGDVYSERMKFDPFRFSKEQEEPESTEKLGDKAHAIVTTGPYFLLFGHGKHACQRSFVVDFESKMMITYILTHYDVRLAAEYAGKRPKSAWLAEATFPDSNGKLSVKRKAVVS